MDEILKNMNNQKRGGENTPSLSIFKRYSVLTFFREFAILYGVSEISPFFHSVLP